MIRGTWGPRLKQVFEGIDDPQWGDEAAPSIRCASPRRATSR